MAGAVHHVALVVAFGEFLVDLVGQAVNNTLVCTNETHTHTHLVYSLSCQTLAPSETLTISLTSQLGVSDAAPLPTAVPQACALHHVTHDIMAFIPLVAYAVHRSIVGGAHLLVSCMKTHRGNSQDSTALNCEVM